jgi:hypothetical protein
VGQELPRRERREETGGTASGEKTLLYGRLLSPLSLFELLLTH